MESNCLMGAAFHLRGWKVLELDSGDGCTTLRRCLMSLIVHLKSLKWRVLYYVYFITI